MINFLSNVWDIESNWFTDWFYSPYFVFNIMKYAVCIMTGIVLAYFICTKEGERMGIKKDDILVCCTFVVPLSILGARIWYMLGDGSPTFKILLNYHKANGVNGFVSFFKSVWETIGYTIGFDFSPLHGFTSYFSTYEGISGLAIHGGIAVAFVMTVICCIKRKWKISVVSDMVAPGLLIGQICGRWGNFFNQEAHGKVVGGWTLIEDELVPNLTVPEQYDVLTKKFLIPKFIAKNMYINDGAESYYYGVKNGEQIYGTLREDAVYGYSNFYHPTFLYESMLNLIALGLYFILRRRKWVRSGFFSGLYLIWYGIVRFFIEIVRTDSLYLPGTQLKSAQVTSIVMILLGGFILVYYAFIKKNDRYVDVIEKFRREQESSSNDNCNNENATVVNVE